MVFDLLSMEDLVTRTVDRTPISCDLQVLRTAQKRTMKHGKHRR